MLDSAEHEIFSANKYENANNSGIFVFLTEKISCSAIFCDKKLWLLVIWDLLAGQSSCLAELSMKKVL